MSRVYFHSPTTTAELHGSERAWLRHLAQGPADAAWNLDTFDAVDRAKQILDMVPEAPEGEFGGNYLHRYLREALEQESTNKAAYEGWRPGQPLRGPTSHEPQGRLAASLRTRLHGEGVTLNVAGVQLHSRNVGLNTALVAGSDPIRLAAKIDGWCESHAWVDGPDRAWLADLIDQGLKAGVFRRGFWYSDVPDGPKDQWSTQGWEEVQALLRSRADEPVVMSYSVDESFPNRGIAGWEPTIDPSWRPDWADGDGHNEWASLTDAEREDYRREHADDQWYDLADTQKWEMAMAGLQQRRPWARLAPDNLADQYFGIPVTVYDLFAPDRDERVRAAGGLNSEREAMR